MYGLFTYIWLIYMVNVGKYTSPMDPMSPSIFAIACDWGKLLKFPPDYSSFPPPFRALFSQYVRNFPENQRPRCHPSSIPSDCIHDDSPSGLETKKNGGDAQFVSSWL